MPTKKRVTIFVVTRLLLRWWAGEDYPSQGSGFAECACGEVGALIEASVALSSARPQSKNAYAKAFRRIVADIENIEGAGRYDGKNGGNEKWKARVDRVPLVRITPAKVQAWKNGFIDAASDDTVARRRRISTFNGLLASSKALFAKKLIHFLRDQVALPESLPFEGITKEKGPSLRYRSKIDVKEILKNAKEELAEANPEAFKIILLAGVSARG